MLLATSLWLGLALQGQTSAVSGTAASTVEAQRLQGEGQLDQARDMYEQVLLRAPEDTPAQEGMAAVSEGLSLKERAAGNINGALEDLVRARKVEPENKRVLLDLGILEEEMSLHMDSLSTLEHLVSLKPVDPNTYYALVRVDMSLGRLEAAEGQMETYLKMRPGDASAHYGLGRIYLQGLQFDKAEQEFRRSIEIQPKQSEGYYQLGQVNLNQNKFEEAIALFQKALERDPQHGGALVGIGEAYFKLKQYDKAKEWLVKATQAAPDYQPGHYYLGLTLARMGDEAGSRRELDVATAPAAKENELSATRLRLQKPDGQP
jgi:tetratricopeptide (TPR) repeat protein